MPNTYNKGTICVERVVSGINQWLAINAQAFYSEWTGCFSVYDAQAERNKGK